jgi:hypothetical protein
MKAPGCWDCPVEEQYQAPPGFYDIPYTYPANFGDVNVTKLGQPVMGMRVPLDGDSEFILRRVAGAASFNVTATPQGFQVYDAIGRRFFSSPVWESANYLLDIPVVPEKGYPPAGQILYDIANFRPAIKMSGASPAAGIYYGQIAFQGVRRYPGALVKPGYRYRESPFTYTTRITINWNAYVWSGGLPVTPNAPRQFIVPVNDYEFELLGVRLFDVRTGAFPTAITMYFHLYDRLNRTVSKSPLVDVLAFENVTAPGLGLLYNTFSPGLIYPAGGQIKFDVYSMLMSAELGPPAPVYEIEFFGIRRLPT